MKITEITHFRHFFSGFDSSIGQSWPNPYPNQGEKSKIVNNSPETARSAVESKVSFLQKPLGLDRDFNVFAENHENDVFD